MSLAALNSPPLVTAAGAGLWAVLPVLKDLDVSSSTLKVANLVAFGLNLVAVSQPGRIDGNASEEQSGKEMKQLSSGSKGRTLVAPSGWAFAIWGPIYLGEMIFSGAQLFLPLKHLKAISVPYCAANIFQSLWCASFRPKYNSGAWMLTSTAMLASTAYSLSHVHAAGLGTFSGWHYMLYTLPLSLHFGWTTAATIVNLNGAIAMMPNVSASTVAVVGHVSVVAATALGIALTWTRSAPIYGSVIAWALAAVADGMKKRMDETANEKDQKRVGIVGAKLQRRLAQAGSLLSAAVSIVVTVMAITGDKK